MNISNQQANQMKQEISINFDSLTLFGNLTIPEKTTGLVLFAHGSGSSRFSPRNNFVAQVLNNANIATLLIDLLTEQEEKIDIITRELRFDIPMLAGRVVATTQWVKNQKNLKDFSLGYFGSSTGAAAALIAAAKVPDIKAVVSRGGRPDLALEYLPEVKAATLLIVGGLDHQVITMNETALKALQCEKKLEIVPGATHLFEEPGKLEEVAQLAAEWFEKYL